MAAILLKRVFQFRCDKYFILSNVPQCPGKIGAGLL